MRWVAYLLILSSLLTFAPIAAQETAPSADDVLYVALVWHQHQPVYFKDPATGVYQRPWVRLHAAKDYLDMATTAAQYPDVHVTFNLSGSLIRQLEDIAAGTKDIYWTMAEIPADELSATDKRFLLERFFDTNRGIIARFPRYQELLVSRDSLGIDDALEAWTTQDFRDLQVLFNLAWTDPDFLAEEPLASLVAKQRDYAESDKRIIFDEHLRIVRQVLPTHAALQEAGQIEVTTTPFAHPILPLLVDSNLAAIAMPDAELPPRLIVGQDAVGQVNLASEIYETHFGRPPRGMWPAEGAVAQSVVQMFASADVEWIATDEGVLARSLPQVEDFTRDSNDTIQQADALYRPYTVIGGRGGRTRIIFRDRLLSDKIGFEYSGTPGEEAAADFINRLSDIQAQLIAEGATGPHLVTVLLDGENAWEFYENDGKDFLNALYRNLSEADHIRAVTPSEFLDMLDEAPRPIDDLWPGSWIDRSYSTWIGEAEENLAWDYLRRTREIFQRESRRLEGEALQRATELMYIAEGSDWFWWYGSDQNSGDDAAFDRQFRGYLALVYDALGVPAPDFVNIPIIPAAPIAPARAPSESFTPPQLDGIASGDEWDDAAFYPLDDAVLEGLYYGLDGNRLYLRLDSTIEYDDSTTIGFYLNLPDDLDSNAYTRFEATGGEPILGFGAERLLEMTFEQGFPNLMVYTADGRGAWNFEGTFETALADGGTLEVSVPLNVISPAARGADRINLRAVLSIDEDNVAIAPLAGPALITLPDEAVPNIVLNVTDISNDDHGPGSYTYPQDAVFVDGVYDITNFVVGSDETHIIFRLNFRGPVENVWNSPNGLSVQTVDIYIDVDGAARGERLLLPGRNAALTPGNAWDVAIWAEGWTPGIYVPGDDGLLELDVDPVIQTNPGQRRVTIRVPRTVLPGDPAAWSYAVTVASQEGFPSAGVWRIRDVLPVAEQWRIGGGVEGVANATRLMDVVNPNPDMQEALLSDFTPSDANIGDLSPDDFGQVAMFSAGE